MPPFHPGMLSSTLRCLIHMSSFDLPANTCALPSYLISVLSFICCLSFLEGCFYTNCTFFPMGGITAISPWNQLTPCSEAQAQLAVNRHPHIGIFSESLQWKKITCRITFQATLFWYLFIYLFISSFTVFFFLNLLVFSTAQAPSSTCSVGSSPLPRSPRATSSSTVRKHWWVSPEPAAPMTA